MVKRQRVVYLLQMGKKKINSKAKTLDGVKFRSTLEADFYSKQKKAKLNMVYEDWSFELSPKIERIYTRFFKKHGKRFIESKADVQSITYTPDFVLYEDDLIVVVECKGLANDRYPVIRSLFLRYLEGLGIDAYFFEPRYPSHNTQVIQTIKQIIDGRK